MIVYKFDKDIRSSLCLKTRSVRSEAWTFHGSRTRRSASHVGLGTVEEEYARNGFFGRYAHLYRQHPPVGWTRIEGPLKPRAYDLRRLEGAKGDDWLSARQGLLGNADVRLSLSTLAAPMPYLFRNADADEILFVHQGAGRLETDFGPLAYEPGDYLLLPRGTSYRLLPTSPSRLLVIEAFSEVFPEKGCWASTRSSTLRCCRCPRPSSSLLGPGEWELRILHCGQQTSSSAPSIRTTWWAGRDVGNISSTCATSGRSARIAATAPLPHHLRHAQRSGVRSARPLENGDPAAQVPSIIRTSTSMRCSSPL